MGKGEFNDFIASNAERLVMGNCEDIISSCAELLQERDLDYDETKIVHALQMMATRFSMV